MSNMCMLIIAAMVLCDVCYAKQFDIYNEKGSAIVQEEGDTLYVEHPSGETDVLFKQDDGLVYNDKGSAVIEEQGDQVFVYKQDGATDVLFEQEE